MKSSLLSLRGTVTSEEYRLWVRRYGDVLQVQLGNNTAVVVNTAAAARALFITQREATNSRPVFYVPHKQGQQGEPVTSIDTGCQGGNVPVDTHNGPYNAARKFTVNLSLTLANETSVEDVKDLPRDLLISEIIYIEDEMSKPHDPTKNFANCIPLLRPLQKIKRLLHLPGSGSSSSHMADIGHRRYAYHEALQTKLRDDITHNVDKPCIQGNVLKDPKNMGLSEGELLSVSMSMMAGADTTKRSVTAPAGAPSRYPVQGVCGHTGGWTARCDLDLFAGLTTFVPERWWLDDDGQTANRHWYYFIVSYLRPSRSSIGAVDARNPIAAPQARSCDFASGCNGYEEDARPKVLIDFLMIDINPS
ncbi:putative Cytochrome P450 [Seiridium cardinale]|uniref:Cytochrome P450 n=1 Tax=Seiridium cardinale TaxID=138064 RepID=A0ABR2X7S2_9PEZI